MNYFVIPDIFQQRMLRLEPPTRKQGRLGRTCHIFLSMVTVPGSSVRCCWTAHLSCLHRESHPLRPLSHESKQSRRPSVGLGASSCHASVAAHAHESALALNHECAHTKSTPPSSPPKQAKTLRTTKAVVANLPAAPTGQIAILTRPLRRCHPSAAHAGARQHRAGKSDQTAVRHWFAILRINLNTEWMWMNI